MELALILGFLSLVAVSAFLGLGMQAERSAWLIVGFLLGGSMIVGAVYCLAFTVLEPQPTPWNLTWVVAVPMLLAITWRLRLSSLALAIPLCFGGLMSFTIVAWALQIPVD
jgi:hypothetical protein